jgi:DNA replication protein DnaC
VACSLGTAAIRLGYSVRYFRTCHLLHALAQARQKASYPNLLRSLARTDLLIMEDWMRDELSPANAQDNLEVLDDRYGQAANIIASHLAITDWFSQIPNPTLADAILDRLIHNAYRIQLIRESQ